MLCLPRAEPPFGVINNGDIGFIRGPQASLNRHCAPTRGNNTINVDITALLKSSDSNESQGFSQQPPVDPPPPLHSIPTLPTHGQQHLPPHHHPPHPPQPPSLARGAVPPPRPVGSMVVPGPRRSMPPQGSDQPVKKQSKWSPEEDALIIELRGSGMKWEDVSKRLPGRSAISCRLHYQNYLERRSEWDEDRKNKLARLYER